MKSDESGSSITGESFADLLGKYVAQSGYSRGQTARLTGIPKATIVSWLKGRVKKPRHVADLLKVAAALHLDEAKASRLLQAAEQPTIAALLAANEQPDLLAPWAQQVRQRQAQAPFQAIPQTPYFVGREREMQQLAQELQAERHATIYCLEGMGGVGKTTLAAHLAYRLRSHFADGVLWARVDSAEPAAILSTFGRAYGVDVSEYADSNSRSRIVRELLASKRTLIVLDNVESSEQVQPLLPPTGPCAVLITTRRRNLSVAYGARRFEIRPFAPDSQSARRLFARMLGENQVVAEREALAEIARLLGYLPLAIAIAASRIAYEPGWSLSGFRDRLRQETARLNELAGENQNVRRLFTLSYKALPPAQQSFFAALGTFSGTDFDVPAAAAVAGVPLAQAQASLRQLHSLSLVQAALHNRYLLHPLLRDFAREQLTDGTTFARLAAYFVNHARQHKGNYPLLEQESDNILHGLEQAWDHELFPLYVSGINAFHHFLEIRGLHELAESHLRRAETAVGSYDAVSLATIRLNLGRIAERRGDYRQAQTDYEAGLDLVIGLEGQKRILTALFQGLAWVAFRQQEYDKVENYLHQAEQVLQMGLVRLARRQMMEKVLHQADQEVQQALTQAIRDHQMMGTMRQGLGLVALQREKREQAQRYWQEAEKHLQQGLELAQSIGFQQGVGSGLLLSLGWIALHRDDNSSAQIHFSKGLALARDSGHQERMTALLLGLGLVFFRLHMLEQAAAYWEEGLRVARAIKHQERVSILLLCTGWASFRRGDPAAAEAHWQESMTLAQRLQRPQRVVLLQQAHSVATPRSLEPQHVAHEKRPDRHEIESMLVWEALQSLSIDSLPNTIWQE